LIQGSDKPEITWKMGSDKPGKNVREIPGTFEKSKATQGTFVTVPLFYFLIIRVSVQMLTTNTVHKHFRSLTC
jgi:hypothetical protein